MRLGLAVLLWVALCVDTATGAAMAATAAVTAPAIGPTPSAKPSGGVGVPGAPGALGAAAKPHNDQAIRGDAVHIEGKLYSPQALFIVSRPAERYGRDAIVPEYLAIAPDAAALPYRLRTAVLEAARAPTQPAAAAAAAAANPAPIPAPPHE
jgi:hypothetical protein